MVRLVVLHGKLFMQKGGIEDSKQTTYGCDESHARGRVRG